MDIWVVAAAAGAGYIAQHWKDIMKGGQSMSESSPRSSCFAKHELSRSEQQFQEQSCHFQRFSWTKNLGDDVSEEREHFSRGASTAEDYSTNDLDSGTARMDYIDDCHVLSQTCLSPRFLSNDKLGDSSESSRDLLPKPASKIMAFSNTKRILRSRRTNGKVIKPLNSLESCLMAQLFKEHSEAEEHVLGSIPSPSTPIVRPLLVTDGSRIISRASGHLKNVRTNNLEGKQDKETGSEQTGTVFGVPPLPSTRSNREVNRRRDWGGRLSSSSKMTRVKYNNLQGSSHGAFLFFLGISVGIMSSLLSNKQEVDKLNDLLKQTEDLVQDLQEELELKDSLTVKELTLEDHAAQDTQEDACRRDTLHAFSSERNFNESTENFQKEDSDRKTQEESRRKIEEELEAELAMLELNMSSSTLDGQFSDSLEDSVPDIARGELRADMFDRKPGNQPYADREGSGSSTPHSVNYAVSPRELALRLHELLESRLEERVKELETALLASEKKVRYRESEQHMNSWRQFSNSEAGSSSAQESPTAIDENLAEQPVVIHLSGDALNAYNEAYDEFAKVDGFEEDGLASGEETAHQESPHDFDQNLEWLENGRQSEPPHSVANKRMPLTFVDRGEDHIISSNETDYDDENGNDDEMEKLLIKQILEKTRQGSPAILKARKILFSMDKN